MGHLRRARTFLWSGTREGLLCCRCCQAPVGIFFPLPSLGAVHLVQSRLAALVDTQFRLTHVLLPMRVHPYRLTYSHG
jgi:hypothetical protein